MARQHYKDGFSLIETMISMLTLSILILGGTATLNNAGGFIQGQGSQRNALIIATEVMESYIVDSSQGVDVLEADAASNGGTNQYAQVVTRDGVNYTATVGVQNLTSGGENFVEVRTRVISPQVEPVVLLYRGKSTI